MKSSLRIEIAMILTVDGNDEEVYQSIFAEMGKIKRGQESCGFTTSEVVIDHTVKPGFLEARMIVTPPTA